MAEVVLYQSILQKLGQLSLSSLAQFVLHIATCKVLKINNLCLFKQAFI
jgi:hypothetical protein